MSADAPIPTPAKPEYFDYIRVARETAITDAEVQALVRIYEADYPSDLMMRELRLLRACNAVARASTTVREILASVQSGPSQ